MSTADAHWFLDLRGRECLELDVWAAVRLDAEKLTLGQELGVRNVNETLQALWFPPCSVATARRDFHLARHSCDLLQRKQC